MRAAATLLAAASLALLLAACDSGGASPPTLTTLTPPPASHTAAAPARGTSVIPPGTATGVGRDDCPGGWTAAEIEHLSICYPSDHHAQAASQSIVVALDPTLPSAGAGTPMLTLRTATTYRPPTTCQFHATAPGASAQAMLVPYTVAGVQGMACTAGTKEQVQFTGAVPTQPLPLEFIADDATPAQLDLAKQILATARLR